MAVSHVFTNPVADGPITSIVRPSDWNSAHQLASTFSGNTLGASSWSGTNLVFAATNNLSLSLNGNTLSVSGPDLTQFLTTAALSNHSHGNPTLALTNLSGTTASNSAGLTLSLSAGNYLTSQSNQAFSAQGGSSAFQTLSFNNANGFTFSNNGGAVEGSYTVPTVTNSSWTVSDNASSATVARLAFTNLNGVTLSLSTGAAGQHTIVGSHNALTSQSNQNVTAGNGGFAFQTLSFSNVNGVSFGTSAGSAITASVAAQTNQTGGIYVTAQSTGQSSSSTYDVRTLSFVPDGIISAGWSNGSFRVSATQSNQNVTAGNGGFAFQTLSFSNANGVSFGTSAGSAITASHTVPVVSNAIQSVGSATGSGTNTSRFAADDHVHAGVFSMGVSNVGNSAGDTRVDVGRFVLAGGANITLSQATAANALNTISIVAGAGGGETRLTAYAQSNTTQSTSGTIPLSSLNFHGAGIASVGVSNGSVIISVPAGGGGGDGGVFAGVSTGGNTAGSTGTVSTGNFVLVGSNGITLSQSTGAAGSAATVSIIGVAPLSRFWNGAPIHTGAGQSNSLVSVVPFSVGGPGYVASNLRVAQSWSVATAANASTAYVDASISAVLYSRNGSTLSSILSGSASYTKTWSSNATGSVSGPQELFVTHAAATITPGEYFWAIHVSTTNTATGGANTTALGNTQSAILTGSAATILLPVRAWGAGTNSTQAGVHGLGVIGTTQTRASIALTDLTVTGSRAAGAMLWFEHRNVTFF